jgi:uncharacterized membrane protein
VSDQEKLHVAREQLERLGTLTDCVYAVSLILVIQWLPMPSESVDAGGHLYLVDLFTEFAGNLLAVFIAVVFIILYWLRNTGLGARVDRTDGPYVVLSILSVFFLLFLLYVVRVGSELEGAAARAGESVAVALIGIASSAAFWHARRKGLVRKGISAAELSGLQIESLTEPLTALITLPIAYVGELWWNLSWFAWVPLAKFLSRRIANRGIPK